MQYSTPSIMETSIMEKTSKMEKKLCDGIFWHFYLIKIPRFWKFLKIGNLENGKKLRKIHFFQWKNGIFGGIFGYFWNIFPIFFHVDLQLFFVIGKWWRNSPITMFLTTTTLCHIAWHLSVSFKMPSGALWSSLEHSGALYFYSYPYSNHVK